ncbi:MAG: SAM-dependent methyltransferase [Candidatus Acidiferrales bacterium]
MHARVERTPLAELLAERIRLHGPITFADYMESCLYHPEYGYYSRADHAYRRDYYTNVDVRPIFGRLLARQLHEIWAVMGKPAPFGLVEAGAGNGDLARQVLDFLSESFRDFYLVLDYSAVEMSPTRRAAHSLTLTRHLTEGRAQSVAELPTNIAAGCIFSNELLDALPVHRVVQDRDGLREIYVDFAGGRFCEQVGPVSTPQVHDYFFKQKITLAAGQQAEAGLAACRWISEAGQRLGRGIILTIDYGREARELYDERHMRGTLLAYTRHRASEDFYNAPGEQDLTAHVSFTALDIWGRRSGLDRTGLTSQSNFLLAIARMTAFTDLEREDASEAEKLRARLLFKTLIHPEGMGETFHVFAQHKGIERPALMGLESL